MATFLTTGTRRVVSSRSMPKASAQRLSQSLIHALGSVPSHAGDPVRVAVEGHGYAGVPERMLDQFRVDATPQKHGSTCVPEIVPTNRGRPARFSSGSKCRLITFWASTGVPAVVLKTNGLVTRDWYPEHRFRRALATRVGTSAPYRDEAG